jgi:hypothetical protein
VRVTGDTLRLSYPDDDVLYRLPSLFKLVPGLCLDELTVLGGPAAEVSYETLGGLVANGNGWKVLRYISYSSAMIGFSSLFIGPGHSRVYHRHPQPKHWQSVLEGRDGCASNPSVTIYRATQPGRYGSVLDPNKRVLYEQRSSQDQGSWPGFFNVDAELMAAGEIRKEMLFVVKRGSGIDYEEKGGSSGIAEADDILKGMPVKTWAYIRATCVDLNVSLGDEVEPAQVDIYRDVDEFAWSPMHR